MTNPFVAVLALVLSAGAAAAAVSAADKAACAPDAIKFCGAHMLPPDPKAIGVCMNEHRNELSAACTDVFRRMAAADKHRPTHKPVPKSVPVPQPKPEVPAPKAESVPAKPVSTSLPVPDFLPPVIEPLPPIVTATPEPKEPPVQTVFSTLWDLISNNLGASLCALIIGVWTSNKTGFTAALKTGAQKALGFFKSAEAKVVEVVPALRGELAKLDQRLTELEGKVEAKLTPPTA